MISLDTDRGTTMTTNNRQGVLELADDIPLTLADDPEIELGDLLTVPHVERRMAFVDPAQCRHYWHAPDECPGGQR